MPRSGPPQHQPLCRCTSWLHETTLRLSVDFRLQWLNDNRPISKWLLCRYTNSNISSRISTGTGSRRADFPEGEVERTPRLVVDRRPVEVHWGTTGNLDRLTLRYTEVDSPLLWERKSVQRVLPIHHLEVLKNLFNNFK